MELSIIIVNYRTAGLILDCLRTVYAQTRDITFEIIIVDSGSEDDSRTVVCGAYPSVNWISMGYNAGFARANNEGIRLSKGNAVLLLNPDTLIEDGAIAGCYRQFSRSAYVACGVQLVNPDRSPQISGNFFMKGGLNYLLPLPYLGNFIRSSGQWFGVAKPNVPAADSLVEVDWINGAFLMVKREATEAAGLLDEDFFLYAEEAEWCSRLGRTGKLCIYGQFHVIHLQGASANETFGSEGKGYYNLYDRKGLQIMLSNFVRIRKQFGVGWFLVQLLFYLADVPVFFLGLLLSGLATRRYTWTQFRRYCGNLVVILQKSPIIIANKPYFYKVI